MQNTPAFIGILKCQLKCQCAVDGGNQTPGDDINLKLGSLEDLTSVTSGSEGHNHMMPETICTDLSNGLHAHRSLHMNSGKTVTFNNI
jgi:hypothetical protein